MAASAEVSRIFWEDRVHLEAIRVIEIRAFDLNGGQLRDRRKFLHRDLAAVAFEGTAPVKVSPVAGAIA